ncbi:glycine reductase [Brachyspira aalborgi]|uniref:Glycine reductase n=1 Tax=Brachyspira aalborgi TaxID=29522 RepID=A0A5C8GFQ8_9SPIR|nr:glycine/sarcosine/betaine reductase complex component C subunit alpha [Brachyspira aalborgi]TXJ60775.1 glycine reductase [Brachyspira aalborgi]
MSNTSNNSIVKSMIGETFLSLANALETGQFGKKIVVGITNRGSEHGAEAVSLGGVIAMSRNKNVEVILIGEKNNSGLKTIETDCDEEAHKIMEEMLKKGELDACVTMHYPFPIGVSTVGRVISQANGKESFIATTTGTSATIREQAMFKNAVYGIITAKACGIEVPTVGILNIDSARTVERALKDLASNGYNIKFGTSNRADGGVVLRGNDIITGAVDIVVCDSLTGNILIKMFSSFNSGGSYEAIGYGYGPGIGFGFTMPIFIISRASGSNVIAGAIEYAYQCINGNIISVMNKEEKEVKKCGFDSILESLKPKNSSVSGSDKDKPKVEKEVVTAQISGIEVMDLDAAVDLVMGNGIYAESGMGCTGPIILVSEKNKENAETILKNGGFIS